MPVIDRATGQEELPDRELGRATLKRVQFGEGEPSVHQLSERDETEDQQESREDEPEELKTRVNMYHSIAVGSALTSFMIGFIPNELESRRWSGILQP